MNSAWMRIRETSANEMTYLLWIIPQLGTHVNITSDCALTEILP